jgi:hypothetical protein
MALWMRAKATMAKSNETHSPPTDLPKQSDESLYGSGGIGDFIHIRHLSQDGSTSGDILRRRQVTSNA